MMRFMHSVFFFFGHDAAIIKLVVVTQIAVLSHDPGLEATPGLFNVDPAIFAGMLYTPGIFKPRASLTGRKKLETFMGGWGRLQF
jgi:hypothetical protein